MVATLIFIGAAITPADAETKTMSYIATIRHHSISRAREIKIEGSLTRAKQMATREFGDGFIDHEIVIYEDDGSYWPPLVASRRIEADRWVSHDV